MRRFENILYIVGQDLDREGAAAARVERLARQHGARLSVVRIEEDYHIDQLGRVLTGHLRDRLDEACAHQHEELKRFARQPAWDGLDCSARTLTGKGFIAVVRKVLLDRHDLVVLGTDLETGVGQLAMRLIRKCPCPVYVIKTARLRPAGTVLAAVDVEGGGETAALNRKILGLARSMAELGSQRIQCLHAWNLEYEALLRDPKFDLSADELAAVKESIRTARQETLDQLLGEDGGSAGPLPARLVEGRAAAVIEQTVGRGDVDLLVMGSLGRTGIPGLLIGDLAEEVLQKIECSVLLVKPDGFVTPVRI